MKIARYRSPSTGTAEQGVSSDETPQRSGDLAARALPSVALLPPSPNELLLTVGSSA